MLEFADVGSLRQQDKGERTVSQKALKMCTENMNLRYKILTSFDQKTAEFYDKHILLTMICICWPECWLKQGYAALHVTENGKVSKTLFPLSYEVILTVLIAC